MFDFLVQNKTSSKGEFYVMAAVTDGMFLYIPQAILPVHLTSWIVNKSPL